MGHERLWSSIEDLSGGGRRSWLEVENTFEVSTTALKGYVLGEGPQMYLGAHLQRRVPELKLGIRMTGSSCPGDNAEMGESRRWSIDSYLDINGGASHPGPCLERGTSTKEAGRKWRKWGTPGGDGSDIHMPPLFHSGAPGWSPRPARLGRRSRSYGSVPSSHGPSSAASSTRGASSGWRFSSSRVPCTWHAAAGPAHPRSTHSSTCSSTATCGSCARTCARPAGPP